MKTLFKTFKTFLSSIEKPRPKISKIIELHLFEKWWFNDEILRATGLKEASHS